MERTETKIDVAGGSKEDTQKDKFMTFLLANEGYGIDIKHVKEIIGVQSITELPDMPSYIRGVINLRGKVIPIMDIRLRFSLPAREYDDRTCIIVVNICDNTMGLVVDEVSDVSDIPENQIEPPPVTSRNITSRFIKGIGKIGDKVKIVLDVERLLYDENIDVSDDRAEEPLAA